MKGLVAGLTGFAVLFAATGCSQKKIVLTEVERSYIRSVANTVEINDPEFSDLMRIDSDTQKMLLETGYNLCTELNAGYTSDQFVHEDRENREDTNELMLRIGINTGATHHLCPQHKEVSKN